METIITSYWNKLALITFAFGALASRMVAQAPVMVLPPMELPKLQVEVQKAQLKELLIRTPASLVAGNDGRGFIFKTLADNLPSEYQSQANEIAHTLITEANRYHLDPIFLLAVIKTESHFNPKAHGIKGDLGLMQLLPKTGHWMAARMKMKGHIDLLNPVTNIKIGAAYFSYLRKHFGTKGSRYLAAYNMGIRNVHKLLNEDKEPMIYATRVLKNYRALYSKWAASFPTEKHTVAAN